MKTHEPILIMRKTLDKLDKPNLKNILQNTSPAFLKTVKDIKIRETETLTEQRRQRRRDNLNAMQEPVQDPGSEKWNVDIR